MLNLSHFEGTSLSAELIGQMVNLTRVQTADKEPVIHSDVSYKSPLPSENILLLARLLGGGVQK